MMHAEVLRAQLDYSAATGVFVRKVRSSHNAVVGVPVGIRELHGYIKINVCGGRYYAHRLAWLYVTSRWPTGRLDHKNGDGCDNRFDNLREATRQQNAINRPAKGTRFHRGLGRWTAQIGVNNKSIYLGAFDSEEAAHQAYLDGVRKHHGDEWLTRKGCEPRP